MLEGLEIDPFELEGVVDTQAPSAKTVAKVTSNFDLSFIISSLFNHI
ncbi:hypothetical protein GCHA_0481 [Paraglaciecola chathamensis S18K6]|uniref:Uncharacterized protein n=2 Tax=Paraglaciecola chathamensis TaxID=368405 RepID=A0A8H9IFJ4_9ALTE|nr:hypothetical protein GCHA_0481 [Paraglaciecola chathamensis S18K6]GGZ74585.1 hypothetical protein GCM10011274_36190 [Paraglaciecola oceanifecundans]